MLGVVGEDFLALEGDEIVELRLAAGFNALCEGADESEGGEQMCYLFSNDPVFEAIFEAWISVDDCANEIAHDSVDVAGALGEAAALGIGKDAECAAGEFHEAAGTRKLETCAGTEDALRDAGGDEVAVCFHHPPDVGFVAAGVEFVGQAHVADDGAFVGAAGEGEEGEGRGRHSAESKGGACVGEDD